MTIADVGPVVDDWYCEDEACSFCNGAETD